MGYLISSEARRARRDARGASAAPILLTGRVPLRYYAMMLALTSGGLSMLGMAQGLRLMLLLVGRGCDAINHFFAERCVPCEHLTSEIPVERLIFCGVASLIIERVLPLPRGRSLGGRRRIVFPSGIDPVKLDLVAGLTGGNITGVSHFSVALEGMSQAGGSPWAVDSH